MKYNVALTLAPKLAATAVSTTTFPRIAMSSCGSGLLQSRPMSIISGVVTFIAAYHYIRVFNSWVEAYEYSTHSDAPTLAGVPFNDASGTQIGSSPCLFC